MFWCAIVAFLVKCLVYCVPSLNETKSPADVKTMHGAFCRSSYRQLFVWVKFSCFRLYYPVETRIWRQMIIRVLMSKNIKNRATESAKRSSFSAIQLSFEWRPLSMETGYKYLSNLYTPCPEKRSLRDFWHIVNKIKYIFIIFGTSHPQYLFCYTVEKFFYIAMKLYSADVIMTSSKMPFLLYPRWKKLTVFLIITLPNLNARL